MSNSKTLKQLYDLTIDVWRDPKLYTKEDISLEFLDIAYIQEVADELIDQNICPRCKGELNLDRNSDKAYLKCYSCNTKF